MSWSQGLSYIPISTSMYKHQRQEIMKLYTIHLLKEGQVQRLLFWGSSMLIIIVICDLIFRLCSSTPSVPNVTVPGSLLIGTMTTENHYHSLST
jgi:hypothetical protein